MVMVNVTTVPAAGRAPVRVAVMRAIAVAAPVRSVAVPVVAVCTFIIIMVVIMAMAMALSPATDRGWRLVNAAG